MIPYLKLFPCFIFLCLFLTINSQYSLIVAKEVKSYCEKTAYSTYTIEIDIDIQNNPLDKYIYFYFTATSSIKDLLFKCIIDPKKLKLFCKTNLQQQRVNLKEGDYLTLPYPFPEVEGIVWDYSTFVFTVYRRTIIITEECLESNLRLVSRLNLPDWDLIIKINKIYEGECLLSDTKDNFYSYKMNFEIIGGNLYNSLEETRKDKIGTEILLMQNISMPFLIGPMQSLINLNIRFSSHDYYKNAFCHPINDPIINSTNYLKEGGIDFQCDVPISEQYIFNGPLRRRSFSDNIYAEVSSGTEEDVIDYISLFFTTEKEPNFNLYDEIENKEEDKSGVKDDDEDEDNFEEEEEESDEQVDVKSKFEENEDDEKEKEKTENKKVENVLNKETPNKSNQKLNEQIPSSSSSASKSSTTTVQPPSASSPKSSTTTVQPSSPSPSKSSTSTVQPSSPSPSKSSTSKVQPPSSSPSKSSTTMVQPPSSSSKSSTTSTQPPSQSTTQSSSSSKKSTASSAQIPSAKNLRSLQNNEGEKKKKKHHFLLLDNGKTNFICPDMPVFEIVNTQRGIIYEPLDDKNDKYNIILTGYLKNGYKVYERKIMSLEYTLDEIKFNLSVTNNLVEEISEKKKNISCSLSAGTFFLEKEETTIRCIGDKLEQKKLDNTDITLNWASKENKYLKTIVIKWPKDLTVHSKKLYSYGINALSINKLDYDCYDDKYYFYINIMDMRSEPEISFELEMLNPPSMKAFCKLYTSNLLKCYLDLRLKKITKGTSIRIPLPGQYNISTVEGNYIDFTILPFTDGNQTDYADEGIIADETCGNNVIVGAIQDIGYGYKAAITIIVVFFVIFFIVVLGIGYCVIYEITHRNRKGKYFQHTEEKKQNESTTNQSMSPIANQSNIIAK